MNLTLPSSGFEVKLYDYVPQRVFEQYQEMLAKNVHIDMKDAVVTIDRVAEELGPDRAMKIQNAEDDERRMLMDEARQEIVASHIRAEINLADTHAAERGKIIGMIREIKDGSTTLPIEATIGELSRADYLALQRTVSEIEAKDDAELKKSAGQSDDSSTDSQSAARK